MAPSPVAELRVALTVADFDQAVAFYGEALELEQLADWSDEHGRVIVFSAGRATLEVFDEAQAARVDAIEAGRRVSGTVRLAFEVADSAETPSSRGGRSRAGRGTGAHTVGRPKRASRSARRHATDALLAGLVSRSAAFSSHPLWKGSRA